MTRFDQSPSGGHEPSASGVSHRVQAILEAAEQAARDIRYEAEVERRRMARDSDRRVSEVDDGLRRMAAVADALVERADELRRQVDEMITVLHRPDLDAEAAEPEHAAPGHLEEPARRRVAAPSRPRFTGAGPRSRTERPAARPPQPDPAPVPAMPEPPPEPAQPPPPVGELGPERLVAMQMAMAGRSREEAAERLVRGFGLDDPSPVLDEIYG